MPLTNYHVNSDDFYLTLFKINLFLWRHFDISSVVLFSRTFGSATAIIIFSVRHNDVLDNSLKKIFIAYIYIYIHIYIYMNVKPVCVCVENNKKQKQKKITKTKNTMFVQRIFVFF